MAVELLDGEQFVAGLFGPLRNVRERLDGVAQEPNHVTGFGISHLSDGVHQRAGTSCASGVDSFVGFDVSHGYLTGGSWSPPMLVLYKNSKIVKTGKLVEAEQAYRTHDEHRAAGNPTLSLSGKHEGVVVRR